MHVKENNEGRDKTKTKNEDTKAHCYKLINNKNI